MRGRGWREPRGKPRGTVAMWEEAGLERMREDEGGRGRTGEDGRAGGREPRGKPRGTVAMREEAGRGRERMREDGRGWERMREDERGWERM